MSAEEIQARIDQFSADIDLQKAVLQQLELNKSAAQRELNAIRDPMARLPLEISSDIFLQCLPETPMSDARVAPMLLLNVCNAWSDIALSTPALWAAISLNSPAHILILQAWLRRAHNRALSISFHNGFGDEDAIVLEPYAKQLRHLEISDRNFCVDSIHFELSSLKTLTIRAAQRDPYEEYQADPEEFRTLSLAQVMKLLHLAPNLVECTLLDMATRNHNAFYDMYNDTYNPRKLTMTRLLRLELLETPQTTNRRGFGRAEILKHLTLPALESLALPFNGDSAHVLPLFLQRSSPPLQSLTLSKGGSSLFNLSELDQSLRLIPSLAHVKCYARDESLIDDLFSALADAPSLFLPNLQSLHIQHEFSGLSERSYQRVYRALSIRREQLVRIVIKSGTRPRFNMATSGPDADIGYDLRRLATEEMDIYIGDGDGHNLISV
ncbi:hypothetical protein B0H19DRAFT_1121407 [Mycena capillaripes]|nr:hypothetical protein B0H19DRAFT_1121407 [Mycena capillaripes]